MNYEIVVGFFVAILVISLLLIRRGRKLNLPPGPWVFPFIGSIHLIFVNPCSGVLELSKKYGPIFFLKFGVFPAIVVNDATVAREILSTHSQDFAGRPDVPSVFLVTRGSQDIAFGDYTEAWKIHRKIAHKALRMFGDGMLNLERRILSEICTLCKRLEEKTGTAVDVRESVGNATLNVVCSIVFGHGYSIDHPEYRRLKHSFQFIFEKGRTFQVVDALPALRYVVDFFNSSYMSQLKEAIRVRDEIFEKKFRKLKESFVEGHVSNYAEALLQALAEAEREEGARAKFMNHDRLIMSLFDIFSGGTVSTASAISWSILYMTVWPECQRKVYEELERVLGQPKKAMSAHLEHRLQLPYTEAAVMETFRLSSTAFMALHKARHDVKLRGYDIPKDTLVYVNLWGIHHDEKNWESPFDFKPERFLDSEGVVIRERKRAYLPFSAGIRNCIGEALAKAELFLFFANLMHKYNFTVDPEMPNPDLTGICKLNMVPKPFKVVVRKRF